MIQHVAHARPVLAEWGFLYLHATCGVSAPGKRLSKATLFQRISPSLSTRNVSSPFWRSVASDSASVRRRGRAGVGPLVTPRIFRIRKSRWWRLPRSTRLLALVRMVSGMTVGSRSVNRMTGRSDGSSPWNSCHALSDRCRSATTQSTESSSSASARWTSPTPRTSMSPSRRRRGGRVARWPSVRLSLSLS